MKDSKLACEYALCAGYLLEILQSLIIDIESRELNERIIVNDLDDIVDFQLNPRYESGMNEVRRMLERLRLLTGDQNEPSMGDQYPPQTKASRHQ